MKCPMCGNEKFKEARQCPQHNNEPVCIDCCYRCEYYSKDAGCLFYSKHPPVISREQAIKKRLFVLGFQIEQKRKQAEYYYIHNKPKVGEKLSIELIKLLQEKRRLEHEQAGSPENIINHSDMGDDHSADYRSLCFSKLGGDGTGDNHSNRENSPEN